MRRAVITGDEVREGKRQLCVFRLGDDGYKALSWDWVPVEEIDAHGLEVAVTEDGCGLIWVCGADRLEVFGLERKELDANADRATLADGQVLARGDLAGVFAWATENYVHRGVKATLRSGAEVTLVSEISLGAAAGADGWPVYSRNEYLCDSGWCVTLGVAIAAWARVAFDDRMP